MNSNDPIASLKANSRSVAKPVMSRATYWIDEWMRDAARDLARKAGVTEADVVRECFAHGLRELFSVEPPSPRA